MASIYSPDDYLNVVADHIIQTLTLDAELGSGGSLEIKNWEQEIREDAASFSDYELPAVSATTTGTAEELEGFGGRMTVEFQCAVVVTTAGGKEADVAQEAKRIGSRVVRAVRQQEMPAKEFAGLPADLEGAIAGDLQVSEPRMVADSGTVNSNLRGSAVITFNITIEIIMPVD